MGAPNVRDALSKDEVVELGLRYSKAVLAARDGGYAEKFDRFVELAGESNAIICMSFARLYEVLSPTSLLSTFGLQVRAGVRVPQDNRFDTLRTSVEEPFFPNYSAHIRFGALSLSEIGHVQYGSCSVLLKPSSIDRRASVFEYPLFEFPKKFDVQLGKVIPPGHRATWESRAKLAAVKVAASLEHASEAEMADLIMPAPTDTLSDCIEVHIYGSLTLHSIQSVSLRQPVDEDEALHLKLCSNKLNLYGILAKVAA